jgi:hypothetical protein
MVFDALPHAFWYRFDLAALRSGKRFTVSAVPYRPAGNDRRVSLVHLFGDPWG